jgi:hypothetical protein
MEGFLLFLAAELVVTATLSTIQITARKQLVHKWRVGELSLEELHRLKQTPWFRTLWNPTDKHVKHSKKNN